MTWIKDCDGKNLFFYPEYPVILGILILTFLNHKGAKSEEKILGVFWEVNERDDGSLTGRRLLKRLFLFDRLVQ